MEAAAVNTPRGYLLKAAQIVALCQRASEDTFTPGGKYGDQNPEWLAGSQLRLVNWGGFRRMDLAK